MFKRTGRHPDLVRGPSSNGLPNLPERDLNRQHVFFDLRQGKETLGAEVCDSCCCSVEGMLLLRRPSSIVDVKQAKWLPAQAGCW